MDSTKELTIVIPVRIDSPERKENLDSVVSFFLQNTCATIIVMEADKQQQYFFAGNNDNTLQETNFKERIQTIFVEDEDPVFYRTRYINQLLKISPTNTVGIWDADVLIPLPQIIEAIKNIAIGVTLCSPYDGRCIMLSEKGSINARTDVPRFLDKQEKVEYTPTSRPAVGGAFLVNRDRYVACGGENEHFYGWGPEDAERIKRMEILEESVTRIKGVLFHLFHPIGANSGLKGNKRDVENLVALMETCKRNTEELKEYISSWGESHN